MKKGDAIRIKKVSVSEDNGIVVAIEKYNWISCLFHSIYGIPFFLLLAASFIMIIRGYGLWTLIPVILSLLCWGCSWVNSNDHLKDRIYTELIEDHLFKRGMISAPFITKRFDSHTDTINCITAEGEQHEFFVEFLQEQLPLYVVRIHFS